MSWLILLLSGCLSLKTTEMQAAAALEPTDAEQAEEAWFATLGHDLTLDEWSHARTRACALRIRRLESVVGALDASLSPERADALRVELEPCSEATGLLERLAVLEARRAEQALNTQEASSMRASLLQALPHLPYLPADHPLRRTYEEDVSAYRTGLISRAEAAADHPVTAALWTQLAAKAGGAVQVDPEAAARAALAPDATFMWIEDAACEAFAPTWPRPTNAADTGFEVEVRVTECTDTTSTRSHTEAYTVTEHRSELREEEQCQTTRVTTVTPVENYHCDSDGLNCVLVGAYTDYDTTSETSCWMEEVEYLVPYEVQMTREVNLATRHLGGTLEVHIQTPHGARILPLKPTISLDGDPTTGTPAPPPAADSQARALQGWLQVASDRADQQIAGLVGTALHSASRDRSDTSRAREQLLTAHLAGITVSDPERAFVAEPFGVTFEALLAPDGPDLLLPEPRTPSPRRLYYRQPQEPGLTRDGFPTATATGGVLGQRAAELQAQPTREGAGAFASARGSLSVVSGYDHRGLGLHTWIEGSIHAGARMSPAYTFPNAPDTAEFPALVGLDGQLGGTLGGRAEGFALFAGLAPMTSRHILGGQTSRGTAFPFVVYAELRFLQRYPILATAWSYAQRPQNSALRGVRVDVPVTREVWFTPRIEERTLRTVIHGLDPEDPVDAGFQTLQMVSAGLTFEL